VCEFNEMLAWKNQLVFFSDHSNALERQAMVVGIESDGGLVLGTDDGSTRLRSGTIRLARE
jgi:biotin-(acetyl-CoA carboxylase) ligase